MGNTPGAYLVQPSGTNFLAPGIYPDLHYLLTGLKVVPRTKVVVFAGPLFQGQSYEFTNVDIRGMQVVHPGITVRSMTITML